MWSVSFEKIKVGSVLIVTMCGREKIREYAISQCTCVRDVA